MFESIAKNLWILVTIMLPGMFTYGIWRFLLILNPSTILTNESLTQVDQLGVLTWCIIVSIALLQQSIGLVIEYALYLISWKKSSLGKLNKLFFRRFELASKGKITAYASSIIGNFFLSLNIFVGLLFLLVYFMFFEKLNVNHWIPLFIITFLITAFINIIFRLQTSLKVIDCKNE